MDAIEYARKRNRMTQKKWENTFEKQAQEILVLRHEGGGGQLRNGFWNAAAYFLAYVDCATGLLHKGEGRLEWPVSDAEQQKGGCFGRFADETIYRVKARAKIRGDVPEYFSKSSQNGFLVVEVMEKNAPCPALEEILVEYKKSVVLQDDTLGALKLNKRFGCFEGTITWQNFKVAVILDVDEEDEGSWTRASEAMKKMLSEQEKWDLEMRGFAASQLTPLTREWGKAAEEPTLEITEESFAKRIELQTISMTDDGSFSACFADNGMFFGHSVTVCGSLEKGVISADIEG